MGNSIVPKLKKETRTLYVATKEDAGSADYFEKVRLVLKNNPCLQIVSIDDLLQMRDSKILNLPDAIKTGMVLVNNPYADLQYTFIQAEDAAFRIRNEKYHKILEIAQLLGATSCEVRERSGHEYKRRLNADGTVKNAFWGSATLRLENEQNFKQIMGVNIKDTFAGKVKVSMDSYNEALLIASKTGLDYDAGVSHLIKTRHPNKENSHYSHSYHFDLTQEANTYLDAAFSLSRTGVFDFNANLVESLQKRTTIEIDIYFNFPQAAQIIATS